MANKKQTEQTEHPVEELSLEEAFGKLDQIVANLESPEISLEDSFTEYQKGMELLAHCKATVDTVEKKVLEINAQGEVAESETLNEF
ncbi:MAG: exodeoxyribonuclease VII small subunit [Lachnospiraceae bacterium]|nr:exodeoxyribonuclease VII small subunit [Lachnospiraceae bacterium]